MKRLTKFNFILMHREHKGIAMVTIILLIVAFMAAGFGGYTAYQYVTDPTFTVYGLVDRPLAKIIPEALKEYAVGENAMGFLIYKKDAEIENLFASTPVSAQVNQVKSALFLSKSNPSGQVIVAEFASSETAVEVKNIVDSQRTNIPNEVDERIKIEQKENILIIEEGEGLAGFQGMLLNNPAIQQIDPDNLDAQLITHINLRQATEVKTAVFAGATLVLGMGLLNENFQNMSDTSAFLPVAHAQLISPGDQPGRIAEATGGQASTQQLALTMLSPMIALIGDVTVIGKVQQGSLILDMNMNLMTPDEAFDSVLEMAKVAGFEVPDMTEEEMEAEKTKAREGIKMLLGTMESLKPTVEEMVETFNKQNPGLQLDADFSTSRIHAKIAISGEKIDEFKQIQIQAMTEAPARARDTARLADLNDIIVAVEVYNTDEGEYPGKSSCLELMSGLEKYFMGGTAPEDPSGEQTFGNIRCSKGFYYQAIGNGYAAWAKMELPENGNTDMTPVEYLKNPVNGKEGQFYVIDHGDFLGITTESPPSVPQNQPTKQTGIKRVPRS